MYLELKAKTEKGLSNAEITKMLERSLDGLTPKKVLILPPDFTRYHSGAGYITCEYRRILKERGCRVDIMPTLGTHDPVSRPQWEKMFEGIPYEEMIVHNWRTDVVRLGEVPGDVVSEASGGLWKDPVSCEINRLVMDESYDLILSPGQVVPHEVVGMSNESKNLFVGAGGSDMISKSHMVSTVFGIENLMGKDHSPARKIFDYCMKKFMASRPVLFALTVTTAPEGEIVTHGLFIGNERRALEEAIRLSQEKNVVFVEKPFKKCVVYLPPDEFKTTWLGNKSVYRTRMAIADGGELIVLAPGVTRFGEDLEVDRIIRKYGYKGTSYIMDKFYGNEDLRENMGAAAHLIQASTDGRFKITYAVKEISKEEIEGVGFNAADFDETAKKYDPAKLSYGWNTLENGEEVFFIPNPALGLWIDKKRFDDKL
jgi:nickel-dependent lactate racemase